MHQPGSGPGVMDRLRSGTQSHAGHPDPLRRAWGDHRVTRTRSALPPKGGGGLSLQPSSTGTHSKAPPPRAVRTAEWRPCLGSGGQTGGDTAGLRALHPCSRGHVPPHSCQSTARVRCGLPLWGSVSPPGWRPPRPPREQAPRPKDADQTRVICTQGVPKPRGDSGPTKHPAHGEDSGRDTAAWLVGSPGPRALPSAPLLLDKEPAGSTGSRAPPATVRPSGRRRHAVWAPALNT